MLKNVWDSNPEVSSYGKKFGVRMPPSPMFGGSLGSEHRRILLILVENPGFESRCLLIVERVRAPNPTASSYCWWKSESLRLLLLTELRGPKPAVSKKQRLLILAGVQGLNTAASYGCWRKVRGPNNAASCWYKYLAGVRGLNLNASYHCWWKSELAPPPSIDAVMGSETRRLPLVESSGSDIYPPLFYERSSGSEPAAS